MTLSGQAAITLRPEQFGEARRVLASYGELTASTFRYDSGVCALRIENALGHLTLLPFQGQQIWDAAFRGRALQMRSMFDEPVETTEYLKTYGALLIHCGATAMGGPGPEDSHPLHGELPNARYREAKLLIGADSGGAYMGLSGSYRHTVAFTHNYSAEPEVVLHAGSSRIHAGIRVRNLKHAPMELMYLAHVNFRSVDGAALIDTVPDDPRRLRLRAASPRGFAMSRRQEQLIARMRDRPAAHRSITPELATDPELVFYMDCCADAQGWAHAMQALPDGTADFISQRPGELPRAVRWIARNADQDALGLVLPATAEADGYSAEKAKGHIVTIPALGEFACRYEFGVLDAEEARAMRQRIEEVMRG